MFDFNGIQQGWQCPICKRVYSPTTPMCYYCGGDNRTSVDTTTYPIGTGIDYKKYDSVTTADTEGDKE